MSARTRTLTALSSTAALAAAVVTVGVGAAHADSAALPTAQQLFISEIHPDNGASGATTGTTNVDDNYEFFEVTNTTGAAINLASQGIAISYSTSATPATSAKFAVSDGDSADAVAAGPLDVTIPAHGSTVFWLEYTSSATLNTYARTEADFRAFYSNVPAAAPIVRVEGQPGIANGGSRTLALISGGQVLSSSFLPERAPTTPGISTDLQVPATGNAATFLREDQPTPGSVTADQITVATPEPTPTPTPYNPVQPTPVIVGQAAAGKTLSVEPGAWIPYDTLLTYQWFADGAPIAGATGTTFKPSGKLGGAAITVAVTGSHAGVSTTMTSAPTSPVGSDKGKS